MQEQAKEGFNALPIIMPLVGVLIGGGITFGYQSYFRWHDRKRLRLERLHRLHRFTASLFNEVFVLHRSIVSQIPQNPQVPIWQYVQPVVGYSTVPKEYALDDLVLLGGPKFLSLSNALPMFALERNAAVAALAMYNDRRTELLDALAPHTAFGPNNTVTFNVAYKQIATNVRLEAEVTSLVESLRADLTASRESIYRLTPDFNDMLAHYYKKKKDNPRINLPAQ